jgi:hypothetical protein
MIRYCIGIFSGKVQHFRQFAHTGPKALLSYTVRMFAGRDVAGITERDVEVEDGQEQVLVGLVGIELEPKCGPAVPVSGGGNRGRGRGSLRMD